MLCVAADVFYYLILLLSARYLVVVYDFGMFFEKSGGFSRPPIGVIEGEESEEVEGGVIMRYYALRAKRMSRASWPRVPRVGGCEIRSNKLLKIVPSGSPSWS